ncbi:MAG: hypothetical protein PHS59_17900, partial [Paludibacter sp.]|nr:hypothetical protein [Paludibacter sp.]
MRKNYFLIAFFVLLVVIQGKIYGTNSVVGDNTDLIGSSIIVTTESGQLSSSSGYSKVRSETIAMTATTSFLADIIINGTNQTAIFNVTAANLLSDQPINITAPAGFTVTPSVLPYNGTNVAVTVTYISSLNKTSGQIILRSGDSRTYVNVTGIGTPLVQKNISASPKFTGTGDDESFSVNEAGGFVPSANGYTMEFKVNTNNLNKEFYPYVVSKNGVGFKSIVNSTSVGMFDALSTKNIGDYYNEDKSHTYRYAVTPDNRIFVYRDGISIDTLRAADYGLQSDFAIGTADPVENLLKNPGFESEYNYDNNTAMVTKIDGWQVSPLDQWNSTQNIVKQSINYDQDFNNHILTVSRYMWADGWGAAEISQIVDVAPNEVYTLSALARGGVKSDGTKLGSIKIMEVQDAAKGLAQVVQSNDFATYSMDYTTSASCKQVRVVMYLERDKWGASITALDVDNVKLTGKGRTYDQKIGFDNKFSGVDYFTYDLTGAYAPLAAEINVSSKDLTIDGTNQSVTLNVTAANLLSDQPINITAPAGFTVTPATIPYNGTNVAVTVTYISSLNKTSGQIILRSGDSRTYVNVTGIGT